MSLWLPLLLACTQAPIYGPAYGDTGGEGSDTAGDEPDGGLVFEPSWSATEAVTELQAALDAGLPKPAVARDSFLGLIADGQDDTCPGTTDFDGANPLGCTSEAGYVYAGISQYLDGGDSWALGGDFEIREPEGQLFHGAGHIFLHQDPDGLKVEFSGSWSHDEGEGWLDPGRSGMFAAVVDSMHTDLDGGLDLGGTFVHFDGVSVEGAETAGVVGIRDPAGAWWWVELDDEGCGELRFAEETHEVGCVDLIGPVDTWVAGLDE